MNSNPRWLVLSASPCPFYVTIEWTSDPHSKEKWLKIHHRAARPTNVRCMAYPASKSLFHEVWMCVLHSVDVIESSRTNEHENWCSLAVTTRHSTRWAALTVKMQGIYRSRKYSMCNIRLELVTLHWKLPQSQECANRTLSKMALFSRAPRQKGLWNRERRRRERRKFGRFWHINWEFLAQNTPQFCCSFRTCSQGLTSPPVLFYVTVCIQVDMLQMAWPPPHPALFA